MDSKPPAPIPVTRMPGLGLPRSANIHDGGGSSGTSADGLKIAQGQELLGPCEGCGGSWTREVKRGRKPGTCPVCKQEGPPAG